MSRQDWHISEGRNWKLLKILMEFLLLYCGLFHAFSAVYLWHMEVFAMFTLENVCVFAFHSWLPKWGNTKH